MHVENKYFFVEERPLSALLDWQVLDRNRDRNCNDVRTNILRKCINRIQHTNSSFNSIKKFAPSFRHRHHRRRCRRSDTYFLQSSTIRCMFCSFAMFRSTASNSYFDFLRSNSDRIQLLFIEANAQGEKLNANAALIG